MAGTKVTLSSKDISNIIDDYAQNQGAADSLSVEFSSINDLDVLTTLRVMSVKNPSVDELAPVCEIMLDGQTIQFVDEKGNIIHPVAYNRGGGNKLHLMFKDAPYLYDKIQEAIYALLLKKLTPHLESSN